MKFFSNLSQIFLTIYLIVIKSEKECKQVVNGCTTFIVSSGTGCAWMCSYCSNNLGTNNYYFTDNVCTYQTDVGCVGNPIAGKSYTCCST